LQILHNSLPQKQLDSVDTAQNQHPQLVNQQHQVLTKLHINFNKLLIHSLENTHPQHIWLQPYKWPRAGHTVPARGSDMRPTQHANDGDGSKLRSSRIESFLPDRDLMSLFYPDVRADELHSPSTDSQATGPQQVVLQHLVTVIGIRLLISRMHIRAAVLRCGAGSEWISTPKASVTTPRRKRDLMLAQDAFWN
jgi:hypothetical protein